jgi:hypothetical protein
MYITLYVFIFPILSLLAQPVTIFVYGIWQLFISKYSIIIPDIKQQRIERPLSRVIHGNDRTIFLDTAYPSGTPEGIAIC